MPPTTGTLIRQHRERRELTARELARELGIAPSTLSHWETSVNEPSLQRLREIARICEVPVAELVGDRKRTRRRRRARQSRPGAA